MAAGELDDLFDNKTEMGRDFLGLPDVEKKRVISSRIPEFSLLPPIEQDRVIKSRMPQEKSLLQRAAERYGSGLIGTVGTGIELAKGAAKGALETSRGFEKAVTFGQGERFMRPEDIKQFESMTTARGPLQKVGKGGEKIAETFFPIPGLGEVQAARGAGPLARAGFSALRSGAEMGLKSLVQGASPKEAAETGALSGAAGAVVETGAPYISGLLTKLAKSQYGKVLHPLGRKAKEVAEEHLEDIVESGYGAAAPTKSALAAKFNKRVDQLGRQIGAKYQQLDATTRTRLAPIYEDFNRWVTENAFTKGGAVKDPAVLEAAFKRLDYLQDTLGPYFKTAKPSEVWEIRRALDKYVFRNGLTADESLEAASQVRSGLANALRTQLNAQHPDLASLNNTFHLWRSAAELMNRNITNDIGKLQFARNAGIVGKFLMGATVVGGADVAARQGEFNPWETGAAAALGGLAFESTAWRTVSAVTKAKIAQLLIKGEGRAAARLAGRAVGVTRSRVFNE
jgi:hypothetical protein